MRRLWAPWRMNYIRKQTRDPVKVCVFCAKQHGNDKQEHVLIRGEYSFITLNRFPYTNGHLLVVPYYHCQGIDLLDDDTLLEITRFIRASVVILTHAFHPDGFNIGVNQGAAAGAGVADHIHFHVVPRWNGDVNFMTVVAETRVIPQGLDDVYRILYPMFHANDDIR